MESGMQSTHQRTPLRTCLPLHDFNTYDFSSPLAFDQMGLEDGVSSPDRSLFA